MGDRVIIIRNDYAGPLPVYNGQTGTLSGGEVGTLSVSLDAGPTVTVGRRDVELAYCLTVHKAQGSRYDRVVFIVPPAAADFAQDSHMQYVGLTRGRQGTVCYAL